MGRRNKYFKKGRQPGSRGGCFKKRGGRGGWNPLTNYVTVLAARDKDTKTAQKIYHEIL